MTPVRVLHLIPGEQWAGAEVQAVTLIRHLRDIGVDVRAVVFHRGRVEEALARSGIHVTVIDQRVLGMATCLQRLDQRIRAIRPAVVHVHRYRETVLAAAVLRWHYGPPLMRTVHGLPEPYRGWKAIKMAFYHLLEGAAIRASGATLIAVSEDIASCLRRMFPSAPVHVVPNGIDGGSLRVTRGRAALRREWGVTDGAPLIGFVGRLAPVKGPDLFLEVAAQLQGEIPSLQAVLVGNGHLRRKLEARVAAAGWRWVRFLGHRNDVANVLGAIDVLVMPSRHEGLPTVLLEAMAVGRPIVATAVGGIPEVAVNGESALLVAPGSVETLARATQSLLTDVARAKTLSRTARRVVSHYTAERMAERVRSLYELVGRS